MSGKRPSSLDYEAYVDELAVSSFRRALVARRFDKARSSVDRLVQSADRMWRWVGCQNLAVLELALGYPTDALEALDAAARLYPDVPELVTAARHPAVQLLLDIDELGGALERAEAGSSSAALALLRMGRRDEAEAIARRLDARAPAEASYLLWEASSGDADDLSELLKTFPAPRRNTRLRFRLAQRLETEERSDDAASIYASITACGDDLLEDPVSTVRSYFRLGWLQSARESSRARVQAQESFRSYLTFWEHGRMDRDDVSRARAWLSA